MAQGGTPGSIRGDDGSFSVWRVPNFLLESRGSFLGERDRLLDKLARWRSAVGVLTVAGLALADHAYAVARTGTAHQSADWAGGLTRAATWSVLAVAAFMVLVVAATHSGARLSMAGSLARTLVTLVGFAGLLAAIAGIIDLVGKNGTPWAAHQKPLLHYGADLVMTAAIVVVLVWILKAVYLVVVDTFRADDAHPLLAAVITTVLAWTLTGFLPLAQALRGAPHGTSRWIEFLGPIVITGINAVVCGRLIQRYQNLFFRFGPAPPLR